eukprot:CAMPEP_0170461752 /NCGR_PEP_ID=MMETSP0123-20130129/7532_1 /TAXON_ID=182087 /ORGANISM="Favella ehrenbergii, Strain Fehren 1" /LENGTH=60 /DNA_ID=CAMNT_0010726835 /DNA_START=63 /DNA_END=245 /DNA_ORIENTATION=-
MTVVPMAFSVTIGVATRLIVVAVVTSSQVVLHLSLRVEQLSKTDVLGDRHASCDGKNSAD